MRNVDKKINYNRLKTQSVVIEARQWDWSHLQSCYSSSVAESRGAEWQSSLSQEPTIEIECQTLAYSCSNKSVEDNGVSQPSSASPPIRLDGGRLFRPMSSFLPLIHLPEISTLYCEKYQIHLIEEKIKVQSQQDHLSGIRPDPSWGIVTISNSCSTMAKQ